MHRFRLPHLSPTRRHQARGFSLIEALVGLTLLALVLSFSLVVLYQLPRYLHRLQARQEANRVAESVLESVRAGVVPLTPGYHPLPLLDVQVSAAEKLRAWLDVQATETPGLLHVAVFIRYQVLDTPRTLTVETQTWRP